MSAAAGLSLRLLEQGFLPDALVRAGIRRLLQRRLAEERADDSAAAQERLEAFVAAMAQAPVALLTEKANEQHYEVPAAFFVPILGPRMKYSSALYDAPATDLAAAEEAMLARTCERAALADGMEILELGCGWGSLTLWMAERYPRSRITAVSNSASQREFIQARAAARGCTNVRVLTADMNEFEPPSDGGRDGRFDRVVSVEMFEHMRNWELLLGRVASWLRPDGRLFLHIFVHRTCAYPFETAGADASADDFMARHFFSGGMMPADHLLHRFQRDLRLDRHWRVNGRHYARTARDWLARMDAARATLLPILAAVYGNEGRDLWWMRWRVFFLAVEELFAFRGGEEWFVSHYLFSKRPEVA